jgi:hypothetical protein
LSGLPWRLVRSENMPLSISWRTRRLNE